MIIAKVVATKKEAMFAQAKYEDKFLISIFIHANIYYQLFKLSHFKGFPFLFNLR